MFFYSERVVENLARVSVVVTERSIGHIGYEKSPMRNVQQWGILVNGLRTEPAIWRNV